MEYLNHVLGIHTVYKDGNFSVMPNYINSRYRIRGVILDGADVVFVYPKNELESINSVKKHIERIKLTTGIPAILVLDRITYRQKEYLLRDRIPFIVEEKQIYLPFLGVYLQQRCDSEKNDSGIILPSAQLLLLYFIYHGCGEMLTKDAAQVLSFTATSISRASRQLEMYDLIKSEKRGVQKVVYSDNTPRELFEKAKKFLTNPVKRTIYVPKKEVKAGLLLSGYSALSEYSMLSPPNVECFAAGSIAEWDKFSSAKLHNSNDQYAIELWRYEPKKLTVGKYVDRLSLALALRHDKDERTEEAVEEMLKDVWRDIDGKRN
ncbi:MAG: hypothetical protein ACOYJX_09815 [Acutalibacteraceae bacterium]|mgnify:CR=1 FL=1|jgi:DNA-binding MarR family transcriptional regulator